MTDILLYTITFLAKVGLGGGGKEEYEKSTNMTDMTYCRGDAKELIIIIIIIIIQNESHSNIIVDRLQGCSHSKTLRESESESRSSKVV